MVPQVLRIDYTLSDSSDADVRNRYFVQYSGTAPTNAQLATMATSLAADWASNQASLFHSDVQLTQIEVTDLTTAVAARGIWTGSNAGSRTGTVLPAGTCALINWTIQRRYRGGKPRSYWPAGTNTDVSTGQTWSGAFITACGTAAGTLVTNFSNTIAVWGTYVSHVNVSYYSGFSNYTGPTGRMRARSTVRAAAVVDAVVGLSVNTRFASQRRRNRP